MPNDAKLGLLAGVMGVIVAAVLSAQRPVPSPGANVAPPQAAAPKAVAKPVAPEANATTPPRAPEALPTDLSSTPVVRTRKEPDATPASRTRNDDDIDP
jgi:hypothetical protein